MPINYLNLKPQISEYCRGALEQFKQQPEKIIAAINLLQCFADEINKNPFTSLAMLESDSPAKRCARPVGEDMSSAFMGNNSGPYNLLASDGSQISSTHHDALPVSLINTSTIFFQPNSSAAPEVHTQTEFLRGDHGDISTSIMPESLVNTMRDIQEVEVLADFAYTDPVPMIALGDGPLELFQEPRSGDAHQVLFRQYQEALFAMCKKERIIAGYTDKPRADLVVNMLKLAYEKEELPDISGITDADIFSAILPPASRSALFQLNSPSSPAYQGPITLYFFYLNVGTENNPWIVRVEILRCAAEQPEKVALLHKALLAQCELMGNAPYPYILHRAHEEAVVHFDERESIMDMLSHALRDLGVEVNKISNKMNAKVLEKRTRLK